MRVIGGLARIRGVLVLAGLALAVLPTGSALANSTVGQTGTGAGCFSPSLLLADMNYVVPSGGGTITSFSFQSESVNNGEQVDFMVLRPVSDNTYTVVGKTGTATLQGTGLETFSATIAVQGGDILALWEPGSLANCGFSVASGGGFFHGFFGAPDPNTGDTVAVLNITQNSNFDLNESANLLTDADLALAKPSDVTVNATSPAGAMVNYATPAATDEDLSTVSVGCVPAPGSTFAIGMTTVTCTATDTDGDTHSPGTQTFQVTVKGAADQLSDLHTAVHRVGPGTSLADKIASVQSYLAAGHASDACGTLGAFINQVKAQTGKSIPAVQAGGLIAAAQRIEAVIPCTS